MTFQWDPRKAKINRAKHKVAFADAIGILDDPHAITIDDPHPDEDRYVTIGLDPSCRVLDTAQRAVQADFSPSSSATRTTRIRKESLVMRKEYDFSHGRRRAVIAAAKGKSRITIRLDDDILEWFRQQVDNAGGGSYQTMINGALRAYMESRPEPLEAIVRRVVMEQLQKTSPRQRKARKAA